jgi:hypothetical protein
MDKNSCKNIIIVVLLIFVLLLNYQLYNKRENFTTLTEKSNEAVQNIGKVYADTSGTVSFNNVNITGNLGVTGDSDMSGNLKINGKIYSPTQKYYMQLEDDGNLYIYDMSGNKITSIGNSGFINPTNPILRYDDTGYYVAMQTDGDLCVNNGAGAGGNMACLGKSGFIGGTGNITTNGDIIKNGHIITVAPYGSVNTIYIDDRPVQLIY